MGAVSLEPEAVDVRVKIVLIGAVEHYYELQEGDPEFARHFRVKVDFAESFAGTEATRHATGIFVAQVCQRLGLPHFTAAAVARLLEETHREADDQTRQSAIFARTEALVTESASLCLARPGALVSVADVEAALHARDARHDYMAQRLRESISRGRPADLGAGQHGRADQCADAGRPGRHPLRFPGAGHGAHLRGTRGAGEHRARGGAVRPDPRQGRADPGQLPVGVCLPTLRRWR